MVLREGMQAPYDNAPDARSEGECMCGFKMSARTQDAVVEAAYEHVKYAHPERIKEVK